MMKGLIFQLNRNNNKIRNSRRNKIIIMVSFSFIFYILMCYFTEDSNQPVPGWELNVSRNTSLYINPNKNTLIASPNFSCTRPYLLMIIPSAIKNIEARSAIRHTWASKQSLDFESSKKIIKVAFILGKSKNEKLNALILDESSMHGDIIQEDFIDSYNNLTIKSMMMLKWAIKKCDQATFIMKVDDDIFVNIPVLIEVLKKSQRTGLLMGHVFTNMWPITNPKSKWYIPKYLYSKRTFPPFVAGPGYIMSSDVGLKLYEMGLQTPIVYLEDVFLTGICAKKANLSHTHHSGFGYTNHVLMKIFTRVKYDVTVVCDSPSEIYKIWNMLNYDN